VAGLQIGLGGFGGPGCVPGSCVTNPTIQTLNRLPTDTADPNLLITTSAMRKLGKLRLQAVPSAWLIQTARPLTALQINAARQIAVTAGATVETKSQNPSLSELRNWASAAGILLALGVLAMTVGLIRSETAGDLRTLTATGAGRRTRRTLTGATAALSACSAPCSAPPSPTSPPSPGTAAASAPPSATCRSPTSSSSSSACRSPPLPAAGCSLDANRLPSPGSRSNEPTLCGRSPSHPGQSATRQTQRRNPPSELITCPVTQRASSVASHAISRAGSSGSPQRPLGKAMATLACASPVA
jgi:hypothetical protein